MRDKLMTPLYLVEMVAILASDVEHAEGLEGRYLDIDQLLCENRAKQKLDPIFHINKKRTLDQKKNG